MKEFRKKITQQNEEGLSGQQNPGQESQRTEAPETKPSSQYPFAVPVRHLLSTCLKVCWPGCLSSGGFCKGVRVARGGVVWQAFHSSMCPQDKETIFHLEKKESTFYWEEKETIILLGCGMSRKRPLLLGISETDNLSKSTFSNGYDGFKQILQYKETIIHPELN